MCPDTSDDSDAGDGERKNEDVCARHRCGAGRELVRHLISLCTGEGDLVVDAFPANDSTLVTAAQSRRRAIACVPYFPLAKRIGASLGEFVTRERPRGIAMFPCRPDQMSQRFSEHVDTAALVIAAPPLHRGGPVARTGRLPVCPACAAEVEASRDLQLAGVLLGSWRMLRRGGHLAVITTARHEEGRFLDPAPQIIRQARAMGFRYSQHVIAIRVPVVGEELVVQCTPEELAQLRDERAGSLPPAARVHADVCLFTKPRLEGASKSKRSGR